MNLRRARPTARLLAVLATAGLLAAACGGDDTPTTGGTTPAEATGTGTEASGETVAITAVDYAFEGVPATVAAGTQLTLTNSSTEELHELVAIRLPDDEERSVEEITALPEAEQGAIFDQGPPATVLIAPPGGAPFIPAVGDGTLSEPGRYAFLCFIPQGTDPQEYMDQAQTGQPTAAGTGPPHFVLGMFAETTVE